MQSFQLSLQLRVPFAGTQCELNESNEIKKKTLTTVVSYNTLHGCNSYCVKGYKNIFNLILNDQFVAQL